MKVEIAQITTDPACLEDNACKILNGLDIAKSKGSDLVVFPELALPGYGCMDLFLRPAFLKDQLNQLQKLASQVRGIGALVGFVDFDESIQMPDGSPLKYNSVALIDDGEIKDLVHKTLLPNYDVFDEKRFFAESAKRHLVDFRGRKLGVEICEDVWSDGYQINVSQELANLGAEAIINLSASPFYYGKRQVRAALLRKTSHDTRIPFIYANLVGGQVGYDGEIVFDGQSMAFDRSGRLIALAKPFEEQFLTVDLDADLQGIEPPLFNPNQEIYDCLVFGVKEYFRRTGNKIAHIGLSGGIDSALVAAIAVDALGSENVFGISMPSKYSSQGSKDDAKALANNLRCHFDEITIEKIAESYSETLAEKFSGRESNVAEENIQARIRGNILMAMSNKFGGLVLTTGNKTEIANGYMTLYGDMAGGLAVIGDLPKQLVYELARFRNTRGNYPVIPANSITKPPSAELRPDQTDEAAFGTDYDTLSPLTEDIITGDDLSILSSRYPQNLASQALVRIKSSEYKRRQAAPAIKVTAHTLGHAWRHPIAHKWGGW